MPCPLGDMSELGIPLLSALVAATAVSASRGAAYTASSLRRIVLHKPIPSSVCALALTVAAAALWKRYKSKAVPQQCNSAIRDNLREFLLGENGDDIASNETIERAGDIFFGNSISLYGLSPQQFQAAGVQLCNRTVIECTNDRLALHTSTGVKKALLAIGIERAIVVDIMCGSGNLMMHLMQQLQSPLCMGFECNSRVAECSQKSLAAVLRSTDFQSRCCIFSGDWAMQFAALWQQQLAAANCLPNDAAVVVVAPPWGDGFCFKRGLDLARTHPPVETVLQQLISAMAVAEGSRRPLFACVQTHETMVEVMVTAARNCIPLQIFFPESIGAMLHYNWNGVACVHERLCYTDSFVLGSRKIHQKCCFYYLHCIFDCENVLTHDQESVDSLTKRHRLVARGVADCEAKGSNVGFLLLQIERA